LTFIRDEFSAAKPRKETSLEWAEALVQVAQDALGTGRWARKAVVGGCCGTGLEEIRVLREVVDRTPAL
jgi:methionine synthase I (cobalamin-dependent)